MEAAAGSRCATARSKRVILAGFKLGDWTRTRPARQSDKRLPHRSYRVAAKAATEAASASGNKQAIQTLYRACETRAVPSKDVSDAIKFSFSDGGLCIFVLDGPDGSKPFGDLLTLLEKEKLIDSDEDWPKALGGGEGGRRWNLVFTTLEKKKGWIVRDGVYFPVNAVQKFDSAEKRISNGIFFGHLAALWFSGPMSTQGKRLLFDFTTINFRLLGLKLQRKLKDDYSIEEKVSSGESLKLSDYPFFSWIYVDDNIAVARGGGGGLAIWTRTNPSWELESGVEFQA